MTSIWELAHEKIELEEAADAAEAGGRPELAKLFRNLAIMIGAVIAAVLAANVAIH